MSSAVAEPVETAVQTPRPVKLFAARRSNLLLTKVGVQPIRDAEGRQVDLKPGEKVGFVDGRLEVAIDDGEITLHDGRRLPAAPFLAWLEKHPLNGDLMDGFWEVNLAAPPPSQGELQALQDMAIDLDAKGLRSFIEQETAGWAREDVLEVAQGTLERVEAKLGEQADALAAARAEGEAAAKGKGSQSSGAGTEG